MLIYLCLMILLLDSASKQVIVHVFLSLLYKQLLNCHIILMQIPCYLFTGRYSGSTVFLVTGLLI